MRAAEDFLLKEATERELERKRANLIADYGCRDRPSIIWQCMPVDILAVDTTNDSIRKVVRDGAVEYSDNGWWHGFSSGRQPALVFDGLSSSSATDEVGWVVEIHSDGHVLAGVWRFPELSAIGGTLGPVVGTFYADAFRDFGFVASRIYESSRYAGALLVTCTMLHANKLPLAGSNGQVLAPAVSRGELRWPVHSIDGPEHISTACVAMAARFMNAYGRRGANS